MWQNIKIENVEKIEKCIGEFVVWMHNILPYGKMKIKIYEDSEGIMTGITDDYPAIHCPAGLSENDIEYANFSDF